MEELITEEKKKGKSVFKIIIMIIAIVAALLIGTVLGNQFLNSSKDEVEKLKKEVNTLKKENKKLEEESKATSTATDNNTSTSPDNNTSTETQDKKDYVEKRKCTGVYSGNAVLFKNMQTGAVTNGKLTIELKADETYTLNKDSVIHAIGKYMIIDHVVLLGTLPDTTAGIGEPKYSYVNYLTISDDCKEITSGYGSLFFEPSFTLTKQN